MTTTICPDCGAILDEAESCYDHFGVLLELEFTNADYGRVHHLTVLAYMLQHPGRLSFKGWVEMRRLLHGFILDGLTPEQVRRQNKQLADSGKRNWRFAADGTIFDISGVVWSYRITDVRLDDANQYRADVEQWARSVLKDTEHLSSTAGQTWPNN
jgi:hypothetical protein